MADHVLALAGDVAADRLQEGVGLGAAVTADDVDRRLGAEVGMQFPHQVDSAGRNGDHLVAAPVTQEIVQLLHGGGHVLPILHVGDGDAFLGMDVIERDTARLAARMSRLVQGQECANSDQRRHQGGCRDLLPALDYVPISGFPAVQTHTPLTTGVPVPLVPVQPANPHPGYGLHWNRVSNKNAATMRRLDGNGK